jgi:hypothetical protein
LSPQELTIGSGLLVPPLARDNSRRAVRRELVSRLAGRLTGRGSDESFLSERFCEEPEARFLETGRRSQFITINCEVRVRCHEASGPDSTPHPVSASDSTGLRLELRDKIRIRRRQRDDHRLQFRHEPMLQHPRQVRGAAVAYAAEQQRHLRAGQIKVMTVYGLQESDLGDAHRRRAAAACAQASD